MKRILNEASRAQLIAKSRSADIEKKTGLTRYGMKDTVSVFNSPNAYNSIDFNAMFKSNVLSLNLPIQGSSSDYTVNVMFEGICDDIQREVRSNNYKVEYKCLYKAIIKAIDHNDIYISCTCNDFKFRQAYYATKGRYNSGTPQITPSRITNPNDTKGAGCKHIMNVIANLDWALKLATCVNNYIIYMSENMPEKYQDIMFPMIYGMTYAKARDDGILSEPNEDDVNVLEPEEDKFNDEEVNEPIGGEESGGEE